MDRNDILKLLETHTTFSKGYDLKDGPFPVPASIGEGFEFSIRDKDYVTKAKTTKDGKRVITFNITTFIGMCGGAVHYYCTARSIVNNVCKDDMRSTVSGYLGGINIPSQFQTLEFELGIPATEDMINGGDSHCKYLDVGDCCTAVRDKSVFYKIIEALKDVFDMNEWEFKIIE